jgi:hypothetical protein
MISNPSTLHRLHQRPLDPRAERRRYDQTFQVAIVGDDGARQTLLGFPTQTDAEAWIGRDRRQSAVDGQQMWGDLRTLREA